MWGDGDRRQAKGKGRGGRTEGERVRATARRTTHSARISPAAPPDTASLSVASRSILATCQASTAPSAPALKTKRRPSVASAVTPPACAATLRAR